MTARILRPVSLALLGLCSLLVAGNASAQTARDEAAHGIGRLDRTPAATLLLPYFEVDLGTPGGNTTLFTIHNTVPEAHLVRATVWSDLAVPVFTFSIYLTGYDQAAVNMRDILAGDTPRQDSESPNGPLSEDNPDLDFSECFFGGPFAPSFVAHMEAALTGQSSTLFGGDCFGVDHGDNVARGFVTLDVIRECALFEIDDPAYFEDGGTGTATNDNVLWGEGMLIRPGTSNLASPLVSIEARDSVSNGFWSLDDPTFYGSIVGYTAEDNREPLATAWGSSFFGDPSSGFGATDFVVWRDPGVLVSSFECGNPPAVYPLPTRQVAVFNQSEDVLAPDLSPSPFPWAVTRVTVTAGLTQPFDNGWALLDLGHSPGTPHDPHVQSYVWTLYDEGSTHGAGVPATPLDNALRPYGGFPEGLGPIFADGFESGDLSAWSAAVP